MLTSLQRKKKKKQLQKKLRRINRTQMERKKLQQDQNTNG